VTGLEQFSVFADMHGIDLIGLVAPQLRPREVADLSGIDDANDMPSLMEGKRNAEAVASGCLQTSMNLSDLVLAEPGNQLMPPSSELAKLLERAFVPTPRLVSNVFLEASMPRDKISFR
jgi:hypothetical protein